VILLFRWLLYSAILRHKPCDLGLIALLLLELMYGKLRDHPLFSAFSQEYREYARREGVKFTCPLFKSVDLSCCTTQRNNSI